MSDKQLIKDNGNNILSQEKYFYILVSGKKAFILSSGRSKSETKDFAIQKLFEKSKSIDALNDKFIYRLTVRKVTKEEKEFEKESEGLSFIGGPIVIVIETIKMIVRKKEPKLKLENIGEGGNSKVFLNNKYLKKYDSIDKTHITKVAYAYAKNITNVAFAINTITDVIKQV